MTTSASFEQRVARLKDACREAGVKLTPQRLEIFREVSCSLEHPDAEAVFRGVQKRMPTVSLDTVYRTLWLLSDLGLITTLGQRRESVRFDANLEHHHHYVCVRCGLARDFDSADLDALTIPDTVQRMGSIVAAQVEVRGVCSSCEGKGPGARQSPKPGRKSERQQQPQPTEMTPTRMAAAPMIAGADDHRPAADQRRGRPRG